ncbi:MAG: transglycosylase domain-containing protein [Saprospiraceae bacterium]|nr:transglycosylase domain-containing protein [Saprospiraceae bacterium]
MEPQHLISIKAALQEKRAPLYRSIVRWTWRLLAGSLLAVIILFLSISFSAIPSFRELEDPSSALASEVLANNGEVLGRYFIENRVPVAYEDLSPHLVNALIATEDERFRQHCGIDAKAVARVMFRTILMRDQSAGGGSTITQQLAKMLYSDRDFAGMGKFQKTLKLIYMKLREWITAVKLERSYTKEEILAMYLNQFNFINNAYGIHAASEVYFGKSQADLSLEEAALLIGMLQNPSYFNPVRFPERAMKRRWIVLYQMYNNGFITKEEFDRVKVIPPDMSRFKRVNFTDDRAPYLCAELKKDLARILDAPESRRPDGSKYNIYKDGLRIYTTIDPVYQQHAEAAMQEHMKKLQERFFQVWKNRDPWAYRTGDTSPKEIEIRKESLWDRVRESERYQNIRPQFFDAITKRVQQKYDFELRDADIKRMLEEEKTAGALSKMITDGYVTPEQASVYRRIMNGPEWSEIKTQYRALQAAAKKAFDTKVPMAVFSWDSPNFEKTVVMSPMDSLRYHRMHLQAGILAMDPSTSEVKAWVGGIHFKHFQFDHIRTDRQVGSTFKPFVYATAIAQQHISPCFSVYDQPVTIPARYQNFTNITDWTPKNATNSYSGARLTLKEALKNSVNSISTYLMKQMGDTEPVRGLCNNMGIDSSLGPNGRYRIPKQPSICLGVADLTVWEMTAAYATFANKGVYGTPYVIREIRDKNGRRIYSSLPEERPALPPNANYVMLEMLKYNVTGAPGVNTLKSEVGGKTGTTQNQTDAWFMGVTPRLVVGTWVGGEDRWIRFTTLSDGQGSRMARPIFAGFISRLEKDPNSGYDFNARFVRPPGDLGIETNCANYTDGAAPPTRDEEFYPDNYKDIYNDELDEERAVPGKKKRPDDTFGDQIR